MFDVVVIGAGHAGLEAACAAARTGGKTLLITKKPDNLGEMSCNPAIGGVAKGTIVREVDALDGIMGRAIDMAGIHFRILNASKGPAVHSPRAQADRRLYKKAVNKILENYPNLEVLFSSVEDIMVEDGVVKGVVANCSSSSVIARSAQHDVAIHLDKNYEANVDRHASHLRSLAMTGSYCEEHNSSSRHCEKDEVRSSNTVSKKITCKSVVLTTGTFLRGVIHIGDKQTPAGRLGEEASYGISETLAKYKFMLGRLKTGTPPRILKDSIDFSELEKQEGDNPAIPFSYLNTEIKVPQTSCFITYTNKKTHEVIKNNLSKSAMYGGHIEGVGPRYCPSIEDKIHRFYEKERHQIFLEPEGLDSDLIYPNGISTSLPLDVQIEFLKTIKGLENCVVTQAGYAIEYDFVDPRELLPTLETKKIRNLFFAGQINGTTGYEEAAGQGIVAGINAALKSQNSDKEFILDRANSYIGVMIDDLTTLGTNEPYRMLTSRAEYRLSLRADNADSRLTRKGIEIGCVSEERKESFERKQQEIAEANKILSNLNISPNRLSSFGVNIKQDGIVRSALQLLSFPEINFNVIEKIWTQEVKNIKSEIRKQVEIEAIYSSYLKRQEQDLELFRQDENMKIPIELDYNKIQSLSLEVREKLNKFRPSTISAAFKIQGITPASVMAVMVYIKNNF